MKQQINKNIFFILIIITLVIMIFISLNLFFFNEHEIEWEADEKIIELKLRMAGESNNPQFLLELAKRYREIAVNGQHRAIDEAKKNIEKAEKISENGVGCIKGKLFHRTDVGTRKLLQKRIDHMNSILKA